MIECPDELALSRTIGGVADLQIEAHVRACATCRDARDGLTEAIALARELPLALPSAERREEVRTAVLAASGSLRPPGRALPRRSARYAVAGAIAAAAAAIYVALPAPREPATPPHAHGTVRGAPGARFAAVAPPPYEVVRFEDGAIEVEVEPLHPGEHFVVLVGDAEVEVRGTAFQVVASDDRLIAVTVHHGRVEVRPRGGNRTVLGPHESWRAPVARAEPPPPAPSPPPPVGPAKRRIVRTEIEPVPAPVSPAPPVRAPDEVAYDEGWAAMRAGNFARAAASFARVFILAPDSSLAEDAAYWRAVAVARGNRSGEAISAFRDFLELYPRSPHAAEASTALGWLLVDAHEPREAEVRFRAAADDRDPTVRHSARAGLAAVAPK